jgi:carbonic anhydrase
MELHVEHQNITDRSRVVIGIFTEATDQTAEMPDLITQIKYFAANPSKTPEAAASFNPSTFLPKGNRSQFQTGL